MNDDPFHKKVFDDNCCNDDDEGKDSAVDAPMMVPILQAIFAMLLTASKTLHEQSEVIARLSRLSKPSLSNTFQSVTPSPRSQGSCLTLPTPVLSLATYSSIGTVTPPQAATVTPVCDSTLPPGQGISWPESAVRSQASSVDKSRDKAGYWQIKQGQLKMFFNMNL